jgi:Ig domain of plant-specific actin-binding protein
MFPYRAQRTLGLVCANTALVASLFLVALTGQASAATTCSASAPSVTCSNTESITINDALTDGEPAASTPEPSNIDVANISGPVTKVTATVNGFSHSCPTDVDMLLVGPHSQESMLMSDIGDCHFASGRPPGPPRPDINLTFDDAAPSGVPCLVTAGPVSTTDLPGGTYSPTDGPPSGDPGTCAFAQSTSTDDNMAVGSPLGPAGPYPTGLATFNGVDPNGTWRLYTVDQWMNDSGHISGGWSITLTITPPTVAAPSISGSATIGTLLSVRAGAVTNGSSPTFQWKRCDLSGTICDVIAGATGVTYTPTTSDLGKTLVVTESATNSGGVTSTNSPHTAQVQSGAAPRAVISLKGTKSTQHVIRQRGVRVSVRSNTAGNLVATGTVRVGHKTYKFKRAKSRLTANARATVKLRLSSKTLSALKRAFATHKRLKAKITLTVTTTGGVKTTVRKTITLKR